MDPAYVVSEDDYRLRLADELEREGDEKLAATVRWCAEHNAECDICEFLADVADDF